MRLILTTALSLAMLALPVSAQFTGPSVQGQAATVADALDGRLGRYVQVTGNIVAHLRGDYFTFADATGQIRVEIARNVWQGREIGPDATVRLLGEVDRGRAGRYLWVKALEVVQ